MPSLHTLARQPKIAKENRDEFARQLKANAPKQNPRGDNWVPETPRSRRSLWAVQSVCKAGHVSIIGVYPQTHNAFPLGMAMNKNLTIRMGNCNHRKYIPDLLDMVRNETIDPREILTNTEPMTAPSKPTRRSMSASRAGSKWN